MRFLASDAGIRQFLDIGTGIQAANNTHEVAQRFAPASRTFYVDNDPIATGQFNQSGGERATNRDRAAVTRLFAGYELVEPGVVRVAEWRPDSELEAARHAAVWADVARNHRPPKSPPPAP